jgi:nucleoside 2-deoxyribosyltransferase
MNEKKQKRLYLAGKITGLPTIEVEQKFKQAEDIYTKLGFSIVNPFELIRTEGSEHEPWEHIMRACLIYMLASDAVVLLHDWKDSKGANLEKDLARKLNIPLFYPHEPIDAPLKHFKL